MSTAQQIQTNTVSARWESDDFVYTYTKSQCMCREETHEHLFVVILQSSMYTNKTEGRVWISTWQIFSLDDLTLRRKVAIRLEDWLHLVLTEGWRYEDIDGFVELTSYGVLADLNRSASSAQSLWRDRDDPRRREYSRHRQHFLSTILIGR